MPERDTPFQEVINQIISDRKTTPNDKVPATDDTLVTSIEKELLPLEAYRERDKLYTDLLRHYIKNFAAKDSWKKWYKLAFFIITLLAFIAIIACSITAIVVVAQKKQPSPIDLGTVLGSIAGILSSLIVVPKVIAQHLFPSNEDTHIIELVKDMQQNDANIREHFQ